MKQMCWLSCHWSILFPSFTCCLCFALPLLVTLFGCPSSEANGHETQLKDPSIVFCRTFGCVATTTTTTALVTKRKKNYKISAQSGITSATSAPLTSRHTHTHRKTTRHTRTRSHSRRYLHNWNSYNSVGSFDPHVWTWRNAKMGCIQINWFDFVSSWGRGMWGEKFCSLSTFFFSPHLFAGFFISLLHWVAVSCEWCPVVRSLPALPLPPVLFPLNRPAAREMFVGG